MGAGSLLNRVHYIKPANIAKFKIFYSVSITSEIRWTADLLIVSHQFSTQAC